MALPRESVQSSNDSNDSADHLRIHSIAKPQEPGQVRRAGTQNQQAVLQAAETAQISTVTPQQNLDRLLPCRQRQRRSWNLLLPVDGEEECARQVGMFPAPDITSPEHVTNGKVRQAEERSE